MMGLVGLGRSKLFHAIVVAGAGMIGGCSRGPVAGEAAFGSGRDAASSRGEDATADRGDNGPSDAGAGDGLLINTTPPDSGADTGVCSCGMHMGVVCYTCSCSCGTGELVDGGSCAPFPCYV
jgi:hypothetical protein